MLRRIAYRSVPAVAALALLVGVIGALAISVLPYEHRATFLGGMILSVLSFLYLQFGRWTQRQRSRSTREIARLYAHVSELNRSSIERYEGLVDADDGFRAEVLDLVVRLLETGNNLDAWRTKVDSDNTSKKKLLEGMSRRMRRLEQSVTQGGSRLEDVLAAQRDLSALNTAVVVSTELSEHLSLAEEIGDVVRRE